MFDRNIWRDFRVFRIQRQPFLKPGSVSGLIAFDGTFRLTHPQSTASSGPMTSMSRRPRRSSSIGQHFDAVDEFAAYAALVHRRSQLRVLSADRRAELIMVPSRWSLLGSK